MGKISSKRAAVVVVCGFCIAHALFWFSLKEKQTKTNERLLSKTGQFYFSTKGSKSL
jgi:hypothetical protein